MKARRSLGHPRPPQMPHPASPVRDRLPWGAWEQQVTRRQKQIAQASQRGDRQAVHRLQQQMLESEAARLLAVRRVAEENQGKDTAGVDGVKSLSASERLAMAEAIHPRFWPQQPVLPGRRVWIAKPGSAERRPLAILPMMDRCKQALVKLALEPEWEAQFEQHSYGFRPGRGAHDAIAALQVALDHHPCYVFHADIAEAFDSVDQAALLEQLQTFSALRQAISAWLTAGVIDGNTYVPSERGIPQGGVLSPLLLNVALHGMEAVVTHGAAREAPLLVRYADDFVILHADLHELQQAIRQVTRWLAARGFQLHPDKTRLTHTLTPYQGPAGFDFLGFTVRQGSEATPVMGRREPVIMPRGKTAMPPFPHWLAPPTPPSRITTIITPSQEADRRHRAAIEQRLRPLHAAPQAQVITELNPLIIGWAAYYNGIVPAETMRRYDDRLEQRLLTWASQRHPGQTRDWLLARYWQSAGKQKRVFATADGVQLRAYRPARLLKT